MAWLALLPGRLLEAVGNDGPRGMIAHDRTRLIGGLPPFPFRRSAAPVTCDTGDHEMKSELMALGNPHGYGVG